MDFLKKVQAKVLPLKSKERGDGQLFSKIETYFKKLQSKVPLTKRGRLILSNEWKPLPVLGVCCLFPGGWPSPEQLFNKTQSSNKTASAFFSAV